MRNEVSDARVHALTTLAGRKTDRPTDPGEGPEGRTSSSSSSSDRQRRKSTCVTAINLLSSICPSVRQTVRPSDCPSVRQTVRPSDLYIPSGSPNFIHIYPTAGIFVEPEDSSRSGQLILFDILLRDGASASHPGTVKEANPVGADLAVIASVCVEGETGAIPRRRPRTKRQHPLCVDGCEWTLRAPPTAAASASAAFQSAAEMRFECEASCGVLLLRLCYFVPLAVSLVRGAAEWSAGAAPLPAACQPEHPRHRNIIHGSAGAIAA
ncbi:hypothetical protein BV898_17883 [Hypsibius exemplaris]|uniref:Uncharacterized protein n=1 Tax=Hypsibius exemplaris TaxID=2072580 RepID=A0A9X6NGF9_HYPEX|nr:hypothetical protein BV898_17883 [Hypsibius exemplaris]